MTGIRILVGTRKGAFILTSDSKRKKWSVDGPHFAGWEIYHLKGSAVDPDRIYASQTSSWFGQIIQRSDDGGKSWSQPGSDDGAEKAAAEGMPQGESNMFVYDISDETGKPLTTHQWYDGTQHPWEFARVWHLEPSLDDPETCYAGVEDAALFRTTDGGATWHELAGLRGHESGPDWAPGAGGMCLHTIVLDPANEARIFCAISAAGTFRSDDGGETWKPINQDPQLKEVFRRHWMVAILLIPGQAEGYPGAGILVCFVLDPLAVTQQPWNTTDLKDSPHHLGPLLESSEGGGP